MMAPNGGCRKHRCDGYAGLAAILVLTGLVGAAVLMSPSLVPRDTQARQAGEERALERIANALLTSIRTTQSIPGATNWVSTVTDFSAMNQGAVQNVYPGFSADTTTRRVFLIDPRLGSTTLPYVQTGVGLTGLLTNLASSGARVMLISNTRRGLALPVSSGVAGSTNEFNAIWDWAYDPATKAPPSGWSSSWTGYGADLHVARINLANLFYNVTLNNLLYAIDTNALSLPVLTLTELKLLEGTLLKIYQTNGTLDQAQRISGDANFEFATTNSSPPMVYYRLAERSGSVATNSGAYGSLWNGVYTNSVTLGQNEPIPPSFPSFPTNNYSAYFDGYHSYVETGRKLTNVLTAFTLAAWIKPAQISSSTVYLLGVRSSLNLGLYSSNKGGGSGTKTLRFYTRRSRTLSVTYPYSLNEWHHVAAVGTGRELRLYLDGKLAGSRTGTTLNYFYDSGYTFRIGANPQNWNGTPYWGSSPQYKGGVDEVVFYTRALSTNELATLATGVIP